jgi:hypothetical protein
MLDVAIDTTKEGDTILATFINLIINNYDRQKERTDKNEKEN